MARPQKEGLEYFPHDVYASSDEKIEPLILLYGSKGYSFYFLHLEYIYRNKELFFDVSEAETREVICQKLRINSEEYEQILHTALKKGCFDREYYEQTGRLTSNGVKKRAAIVTEKREKMRQKYESKRQNISDAETKEETTPETPQSKVKESKDKSKVKESINNINVLFESFWKAYPKKVGKGAAEKAWQKIKPSERLLNEMVEAIQKQRTSKEWIKEDGQFIPNPATWLNQKRWEDCLDKPKGSGKYDLLY